ncbi:MAG: nucleoside-diphosphate sugar epimerase/dehydratase [Myxococcales bacterium]
MMGKGTGKVEIAGTAARVAVVRYGMILTLDAAFTTLALYVALLLRFGGVPSEYVNALATVLPSLVTIRLILTLFARVHHWSFRMSGLNEAVRLVATTVAGSALFVAFSYFFRQFNLPRSVIVLEFFITTTLMAGLRFSPRLAMGWYRDQQRSRQQGATRTVIVGAGEAGDLLMRDIVRSSDTTYHVIGFLDDDPAKIGTSLGGKPVLGSIENLPAIVRREQIAMVLISTPRLEADRIRAMLKLCADQKVNFKIIPASFTYLENRITAAMLHDLSPEDLLPRAAVAFDVARIRSMVVGRRILVTGAGGSIGGEIARQCAAHGPERLVLVDMNENELYFLARHLQEQYPTLRVLAEVADVREGERLMRLGLTHRPQYVFHAAAHKHVPLLEDAPEEAIKNNVFGSLNVAEMAIACAAERFVFISTDKAVHPSSVMGASKRTAELALRQRSATTSTRFTTVRFGNVLGSAGSVVPLFKRQIERGGPVTVTHPDCTRYFMTIPEAVGLVLLAGLGDYGELCILEMGQAIRIADLAANLITMAGFVPGLEIPIVYTGLRPGEKIAEELLTDEEEETLVVRDRIRVAKSVVPANLGHVLDDLRQAMGEGNRGRIIRALRTLIPTYQPSEMALPSASPVPASTGIPAAPASALGSDVATASPRATTKRPILPS